MINHVEKAGNLFLEGYNCAQAVFAAFADVMDMDESTALKLSSSFGGGMGRMREVCGAVSGMFMVAGYLYGYDKPGQDNSQAHYALVQELAAKFKEKHETIICRDLLASLKPGSDPKPTKRDAEFYKKRPCLHFVEDAAAILDELIAEKGI